MFGTFCGKSVRARSHGLTRDEARSSLAYFIALSLQQGRAAACA